MGLDGQKKQQESRDQDLRKEIE